MKKASILVPALIMAIIIISVVIILLVSSKSQQKNSLPGNNQNPVAGNTGGNPASSTPGQEIQESCPSSLNFYYIVDKKNTETFSDDELSVAVKNPDESSYKATLYIDGNLEAEATLLENSTTKIFSKTMTAWWRGGHETDNRSFSAELKIDGCSKSLSELIPVLPTSQSIQRGGGGGGGGGGSHGGTSGSLTLNIEKAPERLPD